MLWHWIADAGGQAAVAKNRIYFRLPDGDVHVGSNNMGLSHIKAFNRESLPTSMAGSRSLPITFLRHIERARCSPASHSYFAW